MRAVSEGLLDRCQHKISFQKNETGATIMAAPASSLDAGDCFGDHWHHRCG
jgi:hypothetical protein